MKYSIKLLLIFLIFSLIPCIFLQAQEKVKDNNLGNWNVVNLQYAFTPKWGTMVEFQARLDEPFHKFYYYEQKGGLYYNVNKTFQVLLGTGHYVTHEIDHFSDGPLTREARLWQQFSFKQNLSRFIFNHRFRIEQRWKNKKFEDRYRYRIQAVLPINRDKIEAKTLFLTAYNEINLTSKAPHFARNRSSIGLGYQINSSLKLQTDLTHQYNYNLEKADSKKILVLTMSIKLKNKSKH